MRVAAEGEEGSAAHAAAAAKTATFKSISLVDSESGSSAGGKKAALLLASADGGSGEFDGDEEDGLVGGPAGIDHHTTGTHTSGKSPFWRHFSALFTKRLLWALRDRKALVFQLLIPVAALLAGLYLLSQVSIVIGIL